MKMEIIPEPEIELDLETEESIELLVKEGLSVGKDDYKKLKNKPSINGTTLIDNYDEVDPTVPGWAKENFKPSYTPGEIGALDSNSEVSFSELKRVWDSVFNS